MRLRNGKSRLLLAENGQIDVKWKITHGKHTLHPSFPFISLIPVEKPKIVVSTLDRQQPNDQADQTQESEGPWAVLFLFLQPEACSIREVYDRNSGTNDHDGDLVLGYERAVVRLSICNRPMIV